MGIFAYLTGRNDTAQDTAQREIYVPTVPNPRPLSCPCAFYGIAVGQLQNNIQPPMLFAETYIRPTANLYSGVPIFYTQSLQGTMPTKT